MIKECVMNTMTELFEEKSYMLKKKYFNDLDEYFCNDIYKVKRRKSSPDT